MPPLNPEPAPTRRANGAFHLAGQWGLAFLLTLGAQAVFRTQGAEFWHADDGAHYVSSAMVAHWLSTGMGSPMDVALDYNSHYPLVSIGLWGPAFYGIFGFLIAVLGGGKVIALGVMAAVIATLAALTAWSVAQLASRPMAWAAAALVAVLPLSIDQSLAFGLDAPVAVAICASVFALGHFLFNGSRAALLLFAVLSLVGLLTKGNAIALYLYGPLVLALSKRSRALRDWRLWLAVISVSVVALPWYIYSYGLTSRGFRAPWGWDFTSQALLSNLVLLYATTGPVLLFLAVLGGWRGFTQGGVAAISLAGAISVYLFQSIVPASINARYLFPMLPFVVVLAACGAKLALDATAPRLRKPSAIGLVVLLVLSLVTLTYPQMKAYHGFGGAADAARRLLPSQNRTILIVGFDVVETTFIAEAAMLQPVKPDLHIIRGSRLLGGGGYNNFEYEPRFNAVEQVAAELAAYHVPMVVISAADRASRWLHISQVQALLDQPASGWRLAWQSDGSDDVRIYLNDVNAKQQGSVALIEKLSAPRRDALSPAKNRAHP